MPKYFMEAIAFDGENIQIEGELSHYLKRVLRVRSGEKVILCNGKETDFNCIVESLEPLILKIENQVQCKTEMSSRITLYQGALKSDKMEWIIQKSVELGVHEIVPVHTEHSVVRPKDRGSSENTKLIRYQKIAESAAGQSMRGVVPIVHKPMLWKEAILHATEQDFAIAAHEKEQEKKLTMVSPEIYLPKQIGLWIGPEGGFSKCEIQTMETAGFSIISLGPRILRAETAAIAALAQIAGMLET